jgi:hypothetical protein
MSVRSVLPVIGHSQQTRGVPRILRARMLGVSGQQAGARLPRGIRGYDGRKW